MPSVAKRDVHPSMRESAIPSEQVSQQASHPISAYTSQTKQLPKFSGQKKFKFSEPPPERGHLKSFDAQALSERGSTHHQLIKINQEHGVHHVVRKSLGQARPLAVSKDL